MHSSSFCPGLGLGLETYKGLDNNTDAFTILSALASRLGLAIVPLCHDTDAPLPLRRTPAPPGPCLC